MNSPWPVGTRAEPRPQLIGFPSSGCRRPGSSQGAEADGTWPRSRLANEMLWTAAPAGPGLPGCLAAPRTRERRPVLTHVPGACRPAAGSRFPGWNAEPRRGWGGGGPLFPQAVVGGAETFPTPGPALSSTAGFSICCSKVLLVCKTFTTQEPDLRKNL